MLPLRILYIGLDAGTSRQRADALARLGHSVTLIEAEAFVPRGGLRGRLHWESGGLLCERAVAAGVLAEAERRGRADIDLTWVDGGRYVGPALIEPLRRRGPVVNYNHDDPLGWRDRGSWLLYRRAARHYDVVTVVRRDNVAEAKALGARRVLLVYRSADEEAHAPHALTAADHAEWDSEVLFVGTWMEERGAFMADLLRRGVPLAIRGDRWERAPEWPKIKAAWAGPGTRARADYAKAIQCAQVNLGLLSKGNRDLHTTRSLEIPYLGGLLCAERTPEHLALYDEGVEALFWSDADECAAVCHRALSGGAAARREIAARGRERCLRNGTLNEAMMRYVIEAAFGRGPAGGEAEFAQSAWMSEAAAAAPTTPSFSVE